MRWLAFVLALLLVPALAADYPMVERGRVLEFPRDHGAHPAYRTEWWYVTGWLKTAEGQDLGFQVTFFRVRPRLGEDNPSAFAPRQILFAHAALADPRRGRLLHGERAARAGFGLAQALEANTDVRIDDWWLKLEAGSYRSRIVATDFSLELSLAPTAPILLQGDQGFSQKAADPRHASYYYSRPRLAVSGRVERDGRAVEVSGSAWLDHEWSSGYLPEGAVGWDWVGLHLDDGSALMAFRMRDAAGRPLWAAGSQRPQSGEERRFGPQDVAFVARRQWRSPRTGASYPVALELRVGDRRFELEPLMDDQELDSRASTGAEYWEGAVRVLDGGREIGRGYLELTGYWQRLRM
jgi:predicted secreted hydrolase